MNKIPNCGNCKWRSDGITFEPCKYPLPPLPIWTEKRSMASNLVQHSEGADCPTFAAKEER